MLNNFLDRDLECAGPAVLPRMNGKHSLNIGDNVLVSRRGLCQRFQHSASVAKYAFRQQQQNPGFGKYITERRLPQKEAGTAFTSSVSSSSVDCNRLSNAVLICVSDEDGAATISD